MKNYYKQKIRAKLGLVLDKHSFFLTLKPCKHTVYQYFNRYIVFINKSKIQFEIYSQLTITYTAKILKCLSINQRYNLKSIHN